MNHDKREVFSLTCNNRSFIPLWVKDSSLNLVIVIIILGVGCVMKKKKKNQPSQKLTKNFQAADGEPLVQKGNEASECQSW